MERYQPQFDGGVPTFSAALSSLSVRKDEKREKRGAGAGGPASSAAAVPAPTAAAAAAAGPPAAASAAVPRTPDPIPAVPLTFAGPENSSQYGDVAESVEDGESGRPAANGANSEAGGEAGAAAEGPPPPPVVERHTTPPGKGWDFLRRRVGHEVGSPEEATAQAAWAEMTAEVAPAEAPLTRRFSFHYVVEVQKRKLQLSKMLQRVIKRLATAEDTVFVGMLFVVGRTVVFPSSSFPRSAP